MTSTSPTGENAWLRRARWIVPVIIGGGAILTMGYFSDDAIMEYLGYAALAMMASVLFIRVLRGPLVDTLPFWMLFALFLWNYFIQFYWLAFAAADVQHDPWLRVLGAAMTPTVMSETYRQMTVCFGTAAVTVTLFRYFVRKRATPERLVRPQAAVLACQVSLALGAVLLVGTSAAIYLVGIGPGSDVVLPMRGAGWIMAWKRTVLPGLLLLVVLLGDQLPTRKYYHLGLVALGISALSDMFLTTTRSTLLFTGASFFTAFAARGSIPRSKVMLFLSVVMLTGVLLPITSQMRVARNEGMGTVESWGATRPPSETEDNASVMSGPLGGVMGRSTGVNVLVPIVSAHARVSFDMVLEALTVGGGITDFNSREIYGIQDDEHTSVAPSLLGWFYVAGGELGQVLGISLVVLVLGGVWTFLVTRPLRAPPVTLGLVLTFMISRLSEGTLEGPWWPPVLIFGGFHIGLVKLVQLVEWFADKSDRDLGRTSPSVRDALL